MLKKGFRKYIDLDRSQSLSLGSDHSESQPVSMQEELDQEEQKLELLAIPED